MKKKLAFNIYSLPLLIVENELAQCRLPDSHDIASDDPASAVDRKMQARPAASAGPEAPQNTCALLENRNRPVAASGQEAKKALSSGNMPAANLEQPEKISS